MHFFPPFPRCFLRFLVLGDAPSHSTIGGTNKYHRSGILHGVKAFSSNLYLLFRRIDAHSICLCDAGSFMHCCWLVWREKMACSYITCRYIAIDHLYSSVSWHDAVALRDRRGLLAASCGRILGHLSVCSVIKHHTWEHGCLEQSAYPAAIFLAILHFEIFAGFCGSMAFVFLSPYKSGSQEGLTAQVFASYRRTGLSYN